MRLDILTFKTLAPHMCRPNIEVDVYVVVAKVEDKLFSSGVWDTTESFVGKWREGNNTKTVNAAYGYIMGIHAIKNIGHAKLYLEYVNTMLRPLNGEYVLMKAEASGKLAEGYIRGYDKEKEINIDVTVYQWIKITEEVKKNEGNTIPAKCKECEGI